jgi:DNA-binding CsgD family transcriptional regulator/PAS domain-containing protein
MTMPASTCQQAELIGNIYDAALEPGLWSEILAQIADFTGAQAAGLISKDSMSKAGETHFYSGVDPHYIGLYAQSYALFDPLVALPRVGEIVSIPDLVSYDEYRHGCFFQEWMRPQGWMDLANVALEKPTPTSATLLTIVPAKPAGMVDSLMRRRIADVAPHVQRAFIIGRERQSKSDMARTFAQALDAMSVAVFLIDKRGAVVHANQGAQSMLASGQVLRMANGKLVTGTVRVNRWLAEAVLSVDRDITAASSAASSRLLSGDDGENYVLHMMPLRSGLRRGIGQSHGAAALLLVKSASFRTTRASEAIAKHYRLTPGEHRVLLTIVEADGVPEAARRLAISQATVKTHLNRLFDKTGVSRQTEIVKLVAEFASAMLE